MIRIFILKSVEYFILMCCPKKLFNSLLDLKVLLTKFESDESPMELKINKQTRNQI